jgi:hypothetical protein
MRESRTYGLLTCGQKWLAQLTPFFSAREREEAGCRHRLFFSQVEFCDNLVFRRRSALDNLGERLLDANRTIGQPKKITMIFGRRITKYYRGKLQTELPNPVIRSHYGSGFIKQYVRDHLILRTESASNNVKDYGVNKSVENLPVLRERRPWGFVPHIWPHDQSDFAESWSEWQDLNLRPPRPERGALPDCATLRRKGAVISACTESRKHRQ